MDFLSPELQFFFGGKLNSISELDNLRVDIREVHEKSFRIRYYELLVTNFDRYNKHSKTPIYMYQAICTYG